MEIQYRGDRWLKDGFKHPGLWEFTVETKEKLAKPLVVPPYAAANEEPYITELSEKFRQSPYASRIAFHDHIDEISHSVKNLRPLPYNENPRLYKLALFASRELFDMDPVVYLYNAGKNKGLVYNAFASGYLDQVYIYISESFFTEQNVDMLSDEELIFLLAHELGHAQCCHSLLPMNEKQRLMEYSADRAGMIACAHLIKKRNPDIEPEELARACVRACAGALAKMTLAARALLNNTTVNWNEFDYAKLEEQVEVCFQNATALPKDTGTHPSDAHRAMAATFFGESELFYMCLGLDPANYRNLRSKLQLEHAMCQL